MADFAKLDSQNNESDKTGDDTAQGGRKSGSDEADGEGPSDSKPAGGADSVTKTAGDTVGETTNQVGKATEGLQKTITGLTKEDTDNMAGSLKIHVKLALEVDIRIIARLKGDIAIGIL